MSTNHHDLRLPSKLPKMARLAGTHAPNEEGILSFLFTVD